MKYDKTILLYILAFIVMGAAYNGFGSVATKLTSATQRNVVSQLRIFFIWTFFLTFQTVGHETFDLLKLFGFIILMLGILVFNKIICFFDDDTDDEIDDAFKDNSTS